MGTTANPPSPTDHPSPETAGPRLPRWFITAAALKRITALLVLITAALGTIIVLCTAMPGRSHTGPLPPLTAAQQQAADRLRTDVEALASGIGHRSTFNPRGMAQAAKWIMAAMNDAGFTNPPGETFVQRNARTPNLAYTIAADPASPTAGEVVVIGAHYDTFQGTPGADDNASGVAGLIELARRLAPHAGAGAAQRGLPRQVRLVFFVNEEPPSFQTPDMGSWVYAKACRAAGDNITAMLSLEAIGFYTDEVGYQHYPPLVGGFYPEQGNFIAFVGNLASRGLVRRCIGTFRASAPFPSEGAALPGAVAGVGWSDHWAFWQEGYPALMVTDTAVFRNPHYHLASDKPATLDYASMARVIDGVEAVVRDLAGAPTQPVQRNAAPAHPAPAPPAP